MIHAVDDSGGAVSLQLPDETATLALGEALAKTLPDALTIYLIGDLGAGKTTLARGLLRGLGHAGNVKSPTYTLVESYATSKLNCYHFDFYRLTDPQEFLDAGLDEHFDGAGIRLVEWPDKAAPLLPAADLEIHLEHDGAGRNAHLRALTAAGLQCLNALRNLPPASPRDANS